MISTADQTIQTAPAVALLGGVSLSRLQVYEGCAPDGCAGGSPHLHLACTEAYVVLAGSGSVELLSIADGYQRLDLRPGGALQFEPGVVHRIINDGGLEILVLMQNAGLPENGDAVFTFPSEVLEDAEAYRRSVAIGSIESALERRDRAVAGLMLLKDAFARSDEEGRHMLSALLSRAAELVRPSVGTWLDVVDAGPGAAVVRTRERIDELESGRPVDLAGAQVSQIVMTPERLGMCGRLNALVAEGTRVVEAKPG